MNAHTLQLHIKQEQLELDDFKKSVDAFAGMIRALSDDAAPGMKWLMSVDRGSMMLSAQLVSDEEDFDVEPIFKVIEGGVSDLVSGTAAASCPKKAQDEYKKLVRTVGDRAGHGSLAEIIPIGKGAVPGPALPVTEARAAPAPQAVYKSIGSVTGRILVLNSKKGNQFVMSDEVTGRYVKGSFRESVLAEMRELFKKRATVAGVISSRSDGTITSIDVHGVHPAPESLPELTSLLGVLEA